MSKEDCDAARHYVIENGIRTPLESILVDAVMLVAGKAIEMVVDRIRAKRRAEDATIEAIAAKLSKRSRGPAIVRFLARHPTGVTFSEFQEHREEATGHRLTESTEHEIISATLRNWAMKLKPHGLTIEVSPTADRIRLRAAE